MIKSTLVLALLLLCSNLSAQNLMQVRVTSPTPKTTGEYLSSVGFDICMVNASTTMSVDIVVDNSDLARLQGLGYQPTLIKTGGPYRQARGVDTPPVGYPDLQAILQQLTAVAASYPNLCQLVDLTAKYGTPTTAEGRHIFALKLSDNVTQDEDEPNIMLVSNHHCRELVTPVIALEFINNLTAGYGSDPTITAALNNHEIWIAPTWNPDGYEYVFSTQDLWRKNRRVFANGVGVDLNRNYPAGWSANCSGSTNVSSDLYKGPSVMSEPETQTMMAFSADRNFSKVIDYHSRGRGVNGGFLCTSHPLDSFFVAEGGILATQSGYAGNIIAVPAEGMHYQTQVTLGAYSMLVETALQFQPPYADALVEAATVWPGFLWFINRPTSILGHVTDAQSGQVLQSSIKIDETAFSLNDAFRTNPKNGRYDLILPTGSYTLTFSSLGYADKTVNIAVNGNSSTVADVQLTKLIPETGQPNSSRAGLDLTGAFDIHGDPSYGQNGPFYSDLAIGSLVDFSFQGDPNIPFILIAGPLNANNSVAPIVGSLDLGFFGSQANYSDLVLALDGNNPRTFFDHLARTDANGTQLFRVQVPSTLGIWYSFQALFYASASPPIFSAATRVLIH